MIKISMVPVEHIEHIWPAVEYYVEESLKYFPGRYTTEDIKKGLLNEPRQLWIAFEDNIVYGVVGTHVITYPQMKTLFMHFIGGDKGLERKDAMLGMLQHFAKDNGCSLLEAQGRNGWKKIFKDNGLNSHTICFDIPVE